MGPRVSDEGMESLSSKKIPSKHYGNSYKKIMTIYDTEYFLSSILS
jgi:hypothetical protein